MVNCPSAGVTKILSSILIAIFLFVSVFTVATVVAPEADAACKKPSQAKDCPKNRPVCNPKGQGTCVQCMNNNDCKGKQTCNNNHRCVNPGQQRSGNDPGTADPDPNDFTESVDNQLCKSGTKNLPGVKVDALGGYCIPKDPAGFASEYYTIGLGMIGGVAVIFLIFGGYVLLTSTGNPERLRNGKTFIFYALFGLILAIFGFVFIEVIAVDILHLPGFER